jgi:hypothetical protein
MASREAVRMLEGVYVTVDRMIRERMPLVTVSAAAQRTVDVVFVLGATGVPLVAGDHVFLRLGLNGTATIINWSLAATVAGTPTSGNVQLAVEVGTTLATVASIVASAPPALTADIELNDQPPTTWTTAIADPSYVMVSVTSVDGTLEVVCLTLRVVVG